MGQNALAVVTKPVRGRNFYRTVEKWQQEVWCDEDNYQLMAESGVVYFVIIFQWSIGDDT